MKASHWSICACFARVFTAVLCGLALLLPMDIAQASEARQASREPAESRIREMRYEADHVYRLEGYVGYQIDLEFEPGESFLGMGAGDIEGLAFVAQDNHLFLKPRAARVRTNLVVLTSRRAYHFDYEASPASPDLASRTVIYTLRFRYPDLPEAGEKNPPIPEPPIRNVDYWYCGDAALRPVSASDDGTRTRLRFAAAADLPAVFLRNEDGSESLLNFSVEEGDVVVHRVAGELLLRRGRLGGRVINQGPKGAGERLSSGTVSPQVQRVLREERP